MEFKQGCLRALLTLKAMSLVTSGAREEMLFVLSPGSCLGSSRSPSPIDQLAGRQDSFDRSRLLKVIPLVTFRGR